MGVCVISLGARLDFDLFKQGPRPRVIGHDAQGVFQRGVGGCRVVRFEGGFGPLNQAAELLLFGGGNGGAQGAGKFATGRISPGGVFFQGA